MKNLLTLFLLLLFGFVAASAQNVAELEEQLKTASDTKEKMLLTNQLGEAYLRVDKDKALDYAKQAHNYAKQLNNAGMAGKTAYLIALAYERKRDKRNEEIWLRSSTSFAKQAGDSDLIIKSVDKRSRLAEKDRNYRRAYQINQEAFNYFSENGKSITDLENQYDVLNAQLAREKRKLEEDKNRLEDEILSLTTEKDQLSSEKQKLTTRQKQLVQEKAKVEEEISQKEEALATIAEEKARVEEEKEIKERRINQLSKAAMADSMALLENRLQLEQASSSLQEAETLRNYTLLGSGFIVVLALFFFSLYRSSRKGRRRLQEKNKIIEQERERSDELLHNILPAPVAKELKEFGKAKARQYKEVSVLFSDFENFTKISEQLDPEELVQELDNCFKAFDFIIDQFEDIEKIKTIGDAYMCVSGLSDRSTVPKNIVKAALEMQEFLEEQKQERTRLGKPYFEARIGIHTGPVVAGVVGVNKFAYDIWGDTVNIAARMEARSETGRVNISESTYRKIKYNFDCTYRGKVQAKNKGMVDMYFVNKETSAVPVA